LGASAGGPVVEGDQHAACVSAWLERAAPGLSSEDLLRLFEAALGALWVRTKSTLGEVTLTVIAERVLHNASERFSVLWLLKVDPNAGIQCRELREWIGSVHPAELTEAIRFTLGELLRVIGHLTAEILTPELHLELYGVVLPQAIRVGRTTPSGRYLALDIEGKGS
jgi:hypothetical protein